MSRPVLHIPFGTDTVAARSDHDAVNLIYDTDDDLIKFRRRSDPSIVESLVTDLNGAMVSTYDVATVTSTGTQAALDVGTDASALVIFDNASSLTVQGISGGRAGRELFIKPVNAYLAFVNNSGSAAAADRIILPGSPNFEFNGGWARLIHDGTNWKVVGAHSGGSVAPTFAAGSYTATSAGTWTVAAGDLTTMAHSWDERMITLYINIENTDIVQSGAQPTGLVIANGQYGSATNSLAWEQPCLIVDNGTYVEGKAICATTGTSITFSRMDGAQLAASSGATGIKGTFRFQYN